MRPTHVAAAWAHRLSSVLEAPELISIACQPVVGIEAAAVVGYEALARFGEGSPQEWLAAADRHGLRAELEAAIVSRALDLRPDLPQNCFLTVNVSPDLATTDPVTGALAAHADLSRIVIELTENSETSDLPALLRVRELIVQRGGLLALDDAGSGYSGLRQIAALRPHLIKLDRELVRDAETDEVKLALVEMLGEFAGRLDAWLLVEGVETWSELAAFARLRVPLAQGFLFGKPAAPWARLDEFTVTSVRQLVPRVRLVESATSLIEVVPVVTDDSLSAPTHCLAVGSLGLRVDGFGRPLEVLLPPAYRADAGSTHLPVPVSLRVKAHDSITQVGQRLLSRPAHQRFDPIVVVDEVGVALGLLRVERIIARLAEQSG